MYQTWHTDIWKNEVTSELAACVSGPKDAEVSLQFAVKSLIIIIIIKLLMSVYVLRLFLLL